MVNAPPYVTQELLDNLSTNICIPHGVLHSADSNERISQKFIYTAAKLEVLEYLQTLFNKQVE